MGCCKINAFFSVMIRVKKLKNDKNNKSTMIKVLYLSTHVGDKNELQHIHLTKKEREHVAMQLASKTPYKKILKDVRCSVSNSDLQIIHLMNKKDITNNEESLKLNDKEVKHPFDTVSFEAWVQDFKTQ